MENRCLPAPMSAGIVVRCAIAGAIRPLQIRQHEHREHRAPDSWATFTVRSPQRGQPRESSATPET